MRRTDVSGDVQNLVIARKIKGPVSFFTTMRRSWVWMALGTVVSLFAVAVAVWGPESLRVQEVAGQARSGFAPAASATTTTVTTTAAPTTTSALPVAPDPKKALSPLDITVLELLPKSCAHGWVAPDQGNAPIAHPLTPDGRPPGGVLGDGGQVEITIQGRHEKTVVLHGLRVEVVSRRPAMKGIYLTGICGSSLTPRFFDVDLTRPAPVAVPREGRDGGMVFPPVQLPYRVSSTDVEQFRFTGISPEEDVEWRLHLRWSSAGEMMETPIDHNGKPFRTTSTKAAKKWCWTYVGIGGRAGWIPPSLAASTEQVWCP